ncbi:UDP-3-O-(3-hydroxymyristoyl)glucosamine N-acyltransferase [Tsuneonella troitsensis]|uniref:UDP-3-O-(3-hydroxymyristoyl)glucosamine N-acyltransferase n=1 Tax=Tsuneonella troitsensis TaxID=292222 RepID=UPI0007105801|nr:UDP-3-O-(3-hydroxymyristoyl)glucosamine N-acyltransferase [Tsuneonella troitsensis]
MKINEMTTVACEERIRDVDFDSFGMIGDRGRRIFAPVGTAAQLAAAIANPDVVAVACLPEWAETVPAHMGLCVSPAPLAFVFRNHIAAWERGDYRRNALTTIAPGASVHPSAFVAPEDVVIGPDSVIGPLAVIERNSIIGACCVIGPGVVIGGNGFEVREVDGRQRTIPHAGGVVIGDRVELQANTSVTRSLFWGATEIGADSATDNLVHIAHNVKIGQRCRLAAAAMIAGSTTLGDDVWVGPNATVSNGLIIGDGAHITLGAVVTKDVVAGQRVTGHFAVEHRQFLQFFRTMRAPA